MGIFIAVMGTLFLSSITIVPYLLEVVIDKSSIGYLLLTVIFNPFVDGITLVLAIIVAISSHKRL